MDGRKTAWLRAAGLTFLPVALIFPVASVVRFQPAGPVRLWLLVAFALAAMWVETRAIVKVLGMYRNRRDPFLVAVLPLAVLSVVAYAFSGSLLLLALPALIHRLA